MKKFFREWGFWIQIGISLFLIVLDAISYALLFIPAFPINLFSRVILWGIVNAFLLLLLIQWIIRLEWANYQTTSKIPILKIKRFGIEEKTIYKLTALNNGMGGVGNVATVYDTLFIEVFNNQKKRDALRIWSFVEWFDKEQNLVLSHNGRWHILSPEKEPKKENLQFVNLYSNGLPEKLHFASLNKTNYNGYFSGLERDKSGKDSWDNPDYRLYGEDSYIVKHGVLKVV